jgi:hypothetical protein
MTRTARFALLASALVLVLAAAPAANAGSRQESIFQDDRVLLDPNQRDASLDQLQSLGVDTIHTLVFWDKIAPGSASDTKPSGFNGSDPRAYPAGNWDGYDALVRGARARGMDVLMSPTGDTPEWASSCETAKFRNCRPNVAEYAKFVQAVGRRYSGSYSDEDGSGTLPKVGRWSIWNEPNQRGWITPQISRGVVVSAQIYRDMVNRGVAALRGSGHSSSKIYLGETAPLGKGSLFPGPVQFYRELFCLDPTGARYRGSAARKRKCTRFKRFKVNGVTHHPYNRGSGGPTLKRAPGRNDIVMSSLDRLPGVLAQGVRGRGISSSAAKSIFFTEYGIETNPPDRRFGSSPAKQAEFLNQADYVAFKQRTVKGMSQYELIDEPAPEVFNTGLRFANGADKPSLAAYRLPIWVAKLRGGSLRVFGWTRGSGGQSVAIQNGSGSNFTTVKTVRSNGAGIFFTSVPRRSGSWRLLWNGNTSRVARPGRS